MGVAVVWQMAESVVMRCSPRRGVSGWVKLVLR